MSTATFDTLAAARALEAAGMESAQAAAVIEAVRSAVAEGVATKADLQNGSGRLQLPGSPHLEMRIPQDGWCGLFFFMGGGCTFTTLILAIIGGGSWWLPCGSIAVMIGCYMFNGRGDAPVELED